MSAPVPLAVAPKKKRRLRWVLLALLVLLLAGVWLAPGILARTAYKDKLIADLTADVNGTVHVGEVQLNWLHPVEAFDVSVTDANGRPVLSAQRVGTSKTLLELLLNRNDLGTVRVEQPRAEVTFENGTTNVQQAFAKYLDGPSAPTRPAVTMEVIDGSVKLTDAARNETTELTAVNGTAKVAANPADPIAFTATATAGGVVKVEGEVGTGGKVTLDADGFDLASLAPAVRHFTPDVGVGGKLRSKLSATWTPRENGLPAFSATGDAHLTDLLASAPVMGKEPVRLKAADADVSAAFDGQTLTVTKLRVTCDAGTAGFAGTLDTSASPDQLANQSGLSFDADIDLAKLAAVAPGLLRLKPGTELTSGRVTANVTSGRGEKGTTWAGSVVASKIEGRRDGKRVTWDEPLSATFAGRVRPDGLPAFDSLVVRSDFIGGQARGEPEEFDAIANIDLTALGKHLEDLLDLNGLKLAGYAEKLLVQVRAKPSGGWTLTAGGTVKNLSVSDNTGVLVADPSLVLSANADIGLRDGKIRIDAGKVNVTAGADTLGVVLLEPVADVKAAAADFMKDQTLPAAKADVSLTGDLNRWKGRVGKLIGWPKEWTVGGTATDATATVTLGKVFTAEKVKVGVKNAAFTGMGLTIDEPALRLDAADGGTVTFDPKTGVTVFTRVAVSSETASGAVARFEIAPVGRTDFGGSGKANVVVRLDRLQKTLGMQKAADLSDQFRGTATGAVALDATTFDKLNFTVDLAVKDFAFGTPKAPVWTEPAATVKGGVGFHLSADTMTLTNAVLERDGVTVSGSGTVAKLTTAMEVNVSGTLGYDLAKMEPLLKQYLGKTATVAGKDSKPFRASGPLFGPAGFDASKPSGTAGVSWTALKAYGFDVGKGELTATADKGTVTCTPIAATFGGGTVRAEPTLRLTPTANTLSLKPGRVVEKAKLTPAVCADALGYALPAIANAAQADGVVSFDLAENSFPLADPASGSFKGTLTIHEGAVSPGPAVTQILDLLDLKTPTVQLAKNSAVPIELKNGRVTHSNFALLVGNTTVTTSGSVGTDGSLDLTVSVPVGGTVAEKLLPNQPVLQKAVAKQSVSVKVKGTLAKPQLDEKGMRDQLAAVVAGAVKDAAKEKGQEVVDDLLKKGLDKLIKPKK